jgi:hypothetical protein
MANRHVTVAATLALGVGVLTPVALDAQARQQAVYVSVLDKAGVPVPDVAPTDVVVREDDVQREVLRVVPADEPMHVAILVDNSEAAEAYILHYRQALPPFISTVIEASGSRGRHQISLIGLAARPTIITQYTSDAAELLQGVQRLFAQPETGTHLLDALSEVSNGIVRLRAARPVIVAIVSAGPDLSNRQHEQVLDSLRSAGAAFHALTIGLPVNLSLERGIVIERGSRETGGVYENLLAGNALVARMKRLAAELTHQHRVIYARPQTLIPPKRVAVSAGRPELTVRGIAATDRDGQVRP